MFTLRPISSPPANFAEFVDEIAVGLRGLFGPESEAQYREQGAKSTELMLVAPSVQTFAVMDGQAGAGLVMSTLLHDTGRIVFIHVLERYLGMGVEARLVRKAVNTLRAGGVEAIVSESIPLCDLSLDDAYSKLGFETIPRSLMIAPLHAPGLSMPDKAASRACTEDDWDALADAICESYVDHPGRRLHVEVRDPARALAFIRSAADGGYGPTRQGYIRVLERNGDTAGVIIGCEAAPDLGFVLQVAVRPAYRGRGVGTQLLRELAERFRKAGLKRVGLGVTQDNPARRLYERLGFEHVRSVCARVWWRP